jgi:hypothetical protein
MTEQINYIVNLAGEELFDLLINVKPACDAWEIVEGVVLASLKIFAWLNVFYLSITVAQTFKRRRTAKGIVIFVIVVVLWLLFSLLLLDPWLDTVSAFSVYLSLLLRIVIALIVSSLSYLSTIHLLVHKLKICK